VGRYGDLVDVLRMGRIVMMNLLAGELSCLYMILVKVESSTRDDHHRSAIPVMFLFSLPAARSIPSSIVECPARCGDRPTSRDASSNSSGRHCGEALRCPFIPWQRCKNPNKHEFMGRSGKENWRCKSLSYYLGSRDGVAPVAELVKLFCREHGEGITSVNCAR
jgi:hypothetical protein